MLTTGRIFRRHTYRYVGNTCFEEPERCHKRQLVRQADTFPTNVCTVHVKNNIFLRRNLFRGLISAIATFQKDGATGGTYFIGFIVVCVASGFIICALGDFFMLAKVRLVPETQQNRSHISRTDNPAFF